MTVVKFFVQSIDNFFNRLKLNSFKFRFLTVNEYNNYKYLLKTIQN